MCYSYLTGTNLEYLEWNKKVCLKKYEIIVPHGISLIKKLLILNKTYDQKYIYKSHRFPYCVKKFRFNKLN